ncbi:pyridoxamine 5'-phosphate oxidase family protein [Occultella glacieicola]|uniref:Pyridoxamine 5'-phosphate oxidase family protein n=1 Tax=Occultella glacieicola TaxID=2518684 RepID=A0ABY2DXR8_9MICO|nr:pyridoxamine 5'-phosphate oxidase family protein [Occultella glacieicola]TDE88813.1 pyridoxamine 5'-phosphate oxidase family protein [Occultella glacieicola]
MATFYDSIEPKLWQFIERQQMFFVATAAADGRVNVSPKGLDTFRILGPNRVAWLNGTGSGNETAAHTALNPRITVMFCAFEGKPWILRLFGTTRMVQPGDADWDELVGLFPPLLGARQVYDIRVEEVQTSCGFGVPLFDFVGQRDLMHSWADRRGAEGLARYQRDKNARSIDGFDGHLPASVLEA